MPKIKKNAFVIKLSTGIFLSANTPREGVIIKCPLNNPFNDPCDMIVMSQMAISDGHD